VRAAKVLAERAVPAALIALALLAMVAPAQAAFPGANGKIAYSTWTDQPVDTDSEIYTMNADGTGQTRLTTNPASDGGQAWSPDGTKIAFNSNRDANFSDIYTMNADGTSLTRLTSDPDYDVDPAWSPDGTKIAFTARRGGNYEIYTMNADGTSQTNLTNSAVFEFHPAWSPDGTKIAFHTGSGGNFEIYTMNADGTNPTNITNHPGSDEYDPDWSPDGTKIAFDSQRDGTFKIYTMNPDGTSQTRLFTSPDVAGIDPSWSPDGTKITFMSWHADIYTVNADGTNLTNITNSSVDYEEGPDWQPIPINSYPRPKGATPFLTYLVPAYAQCTTPNREHGPSLSFGSCNPPTQTSQALTIGSADSNGKPTKSISSVRFETVVGNPSTPGDQADVAITAQITDVYTQAGLADYAGSVTVKTPLRITDKLNTPHPGGPGAGTVSDIPYGFTVPCAETADTTIGGACLLSTSADALAPGAVTEGRRAIWGLGAVEVYDANDALFMKQGIFVP
jgi:Tol biopolymer transport system component